MRINSWWLLVSFSAFIFCALFAHAEVSGPSDILSSADSSHLQKIILSAQNENGLFNGKLSDTYYAIDTLKELDSLNELLKKEKICENAKKGKFSAFFCD
jgi:hypothetical protein